MIVNGQYIDYDEKTIADIQTKINKSDDLSGDLKSEIEKPKDVIDNQQSSWDFTNQAFFDAEYSAERFETYAYYREMDNMEFIHRGLEIVADDATQSNSEGDTIKVYSDNEKIRETLWNLFMERLDMNNELWNIVYDTAKLGDNFFEVVPDDYKNPQKIIFLRYLKPDNIERIEEEGGRLSHFEYKVDGSDDREKEKNAHFRKAIDNQQEVESVYKLQPWQVVHFKVQNNRETDPYGGSLLKAGIRTYRRLSLLEDIILVYRISRAPERRVFKINVGNMNYADAQRFVQKIKEKYRTQSFIDEQGNINKKANMLSITSDIFIPVREGGQGTEVDTLQGGDALNEIKDLDYFKNKILRTMNIPLAYLGDESDRSRGSLCLAPNTKIKLADGRNLEIKEVAKEYQEGKQNYVYSINENNEWVIKPVSWAGITRRNAKTLKITLDNGEEVIATPDHRFMLRDGSYEEAQNLKKGTSLMPIYTKYSSKELKDRIDGYEMLLNNNTGEWEYTHRIAKQDELLIEKNNDTKKTTVHHADFNKLNNNPNNLVLMDRVSHWKLHSERTKKLWKIEEYREKMCKRGFISEEQIKNKIKELNTDKLETISNSLNVNRQTLRFIVQDFGYENWIDFIEKNFDYYKSYRDYKIITKDDLLENIFNPNEKMQDVAKRMKLGVYKIINVIKEEGYNNWFEFITLEKDLKHIFSLSNNLSIKEASEEINCSPTTLTKKMKLAGYKGWKDFRFNHKVISVEDYDILEETYDITVDEETPNFALTAGIVIHNSQMDIKFSRFIERIQSQIIKGLNKIAALELFFQGYKKEDLSNFALELTPPSNIKELVDLDLINQRMGLIGTIQGLDIYSNAWILRNIMKHSDREIAEINMEKQQEVEQQGGEEGGEGGGGDFGGDFGGGEIEGGPDEFGGEEVGGEEFGEEPAPEGGGEEAPAPEEGEAEVASTIINMLGKDFIIENKDDFFKILKASEKYLKEEKRPRDKISMMLEHASDIINSEVKKKSKTKTPEIRKQFIINEMGGLSFSKDGTKESMTLYEGMGEEATEKEVLLNS